MGITAMEVDQSLYIFRSRETIMAIWIYVDDGVIASNSPEAVSNFKSQLCTEVEIKWCDEISQIVGLECMFGKGEVAIAQRRLTDSILAAYPQKIVKIEWPPPVLPTVNSNLKDDILDPTPFQSVIGSLAYILSGS
ncbi:hypothetical protein O181_068233 [Austropuccinia psidii MF-1]|uniref:Reverse transcriptase Ty1/copia-type domain-containing protein n=1 Tax=Austropuccinia psidii MF-1 TaxID=1389203 RepID=A0A9Q3I589_9BASI|nr:hypothetical protein [Austropuccinia psidii MF-1]